MKSKILYAICFAYFLSGYSVYTTKAPLELIRQADPSITAHTDMFTLHQIGLVFMIATVLSSLLLFKNKADWAFSLMTFVITWWALLFILSWIQTGYWQSIYGAANYGMVAIILIMVSRIIEMPPAMQTREPMFSDNAQFNLDKKEGESR